MYSTAALYYEKSLLIRIQNLSIVVRYWEDMLTLFFCILQNQGKELFMFVLEGLSVQIFSLDPCFCINSFLFYAHWIIHVQMLYGCQNVIFLKMLVFDDVLDETA